MCESREPFAGTPVLSPALRDELCELVREVVLEASMPKLLLKPSEAAARLGVCDTIVRRLVREGLLRAVYVTSDLKIPAAELERYVTELRGMGVRRRTRRTPTGRTRHTVSASRVGR